jgi:hypothetical protein
LMFWRIVIAQESIGVTWRLNYRMKSTVRKYRTVENACPGWWNASDWCSRYRANLRLIQYIPSPKAEPFKLWLAQVASDRLDEIQDLELTVHRALQEYLNLVYSENRINQQLKSIEIWKELTDEWKKRGLKESLQFATLTDIITKAWAGKTTKEYKVLKGLKKENLKDNMTNTELILTMLAEASTK